MNNSIKITFATIQLLLLNCTSKPEEPTNKINLNITTEDTNKIKNTFRSNILVLLVKPKENRSNFEINNYCTTEGKIIPIFTSHGKFLESTRGTYLNMQPCNINGKYLLSILQGTETICINPELNDEKIIKAYKLKNHSQ